MTGVFLLNTGSTIEEGRLAKGGSKLTDDYTRECAVCEMNLADFLAMGSPDRVVVDPETFSSGSPLYKGSPVKVEPSNDMVLSAEELTAKLYMLQKRG